jgi:branched-subunit amino acid aminotransferase/4-amino-4-deoxychorismate lyase
MSAAMQAHHASAWRRHPSRHYSIGRDRHDQGAGLPLRSAPTVEEAYQAREAFNTSASQVVLPVVRLDGHSVGNGAPD